MDRTSYVEAPYAESTLERAALPGPVGPPDADVLTLAEHNLDRLIEWVSRIDAKAGFNLLVSTAMAGTLVAVLPEPITSKTELAMAAAAMGLLVLSILAVVAATFPRTRHGASNDGRSLFFFQSISGTSRDEYKHRFSALTATEALDELLNQCHAVAALLTAKFRLMRISYGLLYASILPWLLALAGSPG